MGAWVAQVYVVVNILGSVHSMYLTLKENEWEMNEFYFTVCMLEMSGGSILMSATLKCVKNGMDR